jgi:hypothetical protein
VALIAKTEGVAAAKPVVYQLRDIWNKQLIENKSISPKEAYTKMVDVVQGKLSPEQQQMFLPAAQSWAQSRDIKDYGLL